MRAPRALFSVLLQVTSLGQSRHGAPWGGGAHMAGRICPQTFIRGGVKNNNNNKKSRGRRNGRRWSEASLDQPKTFTVIVFEFTTYYGRKYLKTDLSKLKPEYSLILKVGGSPSFKLAANLWMSHSNTKHKVCAFLIVRHWRKRSERRQQICIVCSHKYKVKR